jgi:replicative DNA helicase
MTAPEVARVIAGAAADVPHHKIRTGRMDADEEARVLALADAWAGQDVFWIRDTTSGTSAETCESYLAWLQFRQQASGGKIALAVLDYLGLLSPSNQRDTEYAAISKNTRALKLAAVRMQIPLVVLCQMNRDGRKQTHSRDGEAQGQVEPTLGALRGSGSIEQDADAVLFLHCPNPPEKGDSGPRIVRATLAASRFCQPGRIDLMFWGEQQRFTTAPEEAQPQTSTPEIAPERRAALGEHAADMLFGDA